MYAVIVITEDFDFTAPIVLFCVQCGLQVPVSCFLPIKYYFVRFIIIDLICLELLGYLKSNASIDFRTSIF